MFLTLRVAHGQLTKGTFDEAAPAFPWDPLDVDKAQGCFSQPAAIGVGCA